MNEENYYEILNLNENASIDSIRANYKKLILIYVLYFTQTVEK